jgi:glucose/arabinose dehydrogenase
VAIRPSSGGGKTEFTPPRLVVVADVVAPPGYRIEAAAAGLSFPSGVAFDEQNRPYVTEAGYSYGEVFLRPRLVRIEPDGSTTVIAAGKNGPWNGVAYHNGAFFVAEGGVMEGGRILRIDGDGKITALVENLPSMGDHHANGPAVGPDGWLYFSVGTVTNAGVVGEDNAKFGWLERFPQLHDIPGQDIQLTGENFRTSNPLTPARFDRATTGAFAPFGTPSQPGQIIPGQIPCSGAVHRIRPEGGAIELVAWGLRNPFGLSFDPGGRLFVSENSFDVRGSRPVWGTGDVLWEIKPGTWYGWPDYHAGKPLHESEHFKAPWKRAPRFLLADHPNVPPSPAAFFGVHSSACGLDFSRSAQFGHEGDAFVALFGDMAPGVGKVVAPVGFRVMRVDLDSGVVHDFLVNRGRVHGPASWLKSGGLERPVAVRFDNTGEALYIVDFGVMTHPRKGPNPVPGTGVLWRVTREPTS